MPTDFEMNVTKGNPGVVCSLSDSNFVVQRSLESSGSMFLAKCGRA